MTNAFSTRAINKSNKRSKAISETEFMALFQLMPVPALLIEYSRGQVISANSPWLKLTAFSLNEIVERPLTDLVGELPERNLAADEMLSVTLERRSRSPLPVNMQVRALDPDGQRLALIFSPQIERRNLMSRMEQFPKILAEINRCNMDLSLQQNLHHSLMLVRQLLDINVAAIYSQPETRDQNQAELHIVKTVEVGEENLLPETLPASDLMRLAEVFIWKPGRRVQTDLHRHARIANLSCVASCLLNENRLLVIADRQMEPEVSLPTVLESMGVQLSGMIIHHHEVTELRRDVHENQRDLAIWQSVSENAQEGILLITPDFLVSKINPAAEWMLGYTDREVNNQPVENILIGPERLLPALEAARDGIPTHNMGNVSLHRRNGQSFPAHIEIVPVQEADETEGIIIFFTDVSENIEIRNRTQQLEQRAVLGEVTAVFAHEVRNPINNISTGLQLMSVMLPENDPNQENINRLLNDCQRLNHLMESVLNFSRHSEHKFEEVDLEMLMNRILDRWRPRMAKVNVTGFCQIPQKTPHVLADPRSLEQVFTNLISNAVEAMSAKGGTLSVKAMPYQAGSGLPQVEITVSDTGPGIPDEIRERIFEPFVTTKAQGTGLGLAITKRIVTAHHGSLTVNSFPGGTVFHVLLSAYQGETE